MIEDSPHPKFLYHYTDWNGFCGILERQNLWATNARFLNDVSETLLFQKEVIEYLENSFRQTPLEGGQIPDVKKLVSEVFQELYGDGIYLTSFCSHEEENTREHGLLSQWRGYGKDTGIALVFNNAELMKLVSLEKNTYEYFALAKPHKVIYKDDKKKYKEDLNPLMNSTEVIVREIHRYQLQEIDNDFFQECIAVRLPDFWQGMCALKHPGFKEEYEFRIVAILPDADYRIDRPKKSYKEIKFRGESAQIPYIELFDSLKKLLLPLERIIVGPQKNQRGVASAIKAKLQNHERDEVKRIKVTISGIPYIGST